MCLSPSNHALFTLVKLAEQKAATEHRYGLVGGKEMTELSVGFSSFV